MLFSVLLYRVYPYPVVFPDTNEYFIQGKDFFHPQNLLIDHARTPLFSLLLYAAYRTSHPSGLLFWFHAVLFCGNILLAYRLGHTLWKNTATAFVSTLLLLGAEVHFMKTFFFSTIALTDALCANLLFASTLFLAEGVIKKNVRTVLLACGIAGLANITRPLGLALIPFLLIAVMPLLLKQRRALLPCLLSLLVLIGPQTAWKIRNIISYNTVISNPYAPLHLVSHPLLFMKEDDNAFADPQVNRDFHTAIQTLTLPPAYNAPAPFRLEKNSYWGIVQAFFASQTPLYRDKGESVLTERDYYVIQTSHVTLGVSKRLILQHPFLYMKQVAHHYAELFDTRSIDDFIQQNFEKDPHPKYALMISINKYLNARLLHSSFWNTDWPNPLAANILEAITSPGRNFMARPLNISIVLFPHVLFLMGLFLCRKSRKTSLGATDAHLGLFMMIVFSVISLHYLTVALLTSLHDRRYALPSSMLLHLLWITGIVMIAVRIIHFFTDDEKDEWYTQTLS